MRKIQPEHYDEFYGEKAMGKFDRPERKTNKNVLDK